MIYIFESTLPSSSVETVTSDTYVRSSSISLLLEESVYRPMAIESKSLEDILEWLQESGFSESVIEKFEGVCNIIAFLFVRPISSYYTYVTFIWDVFFSVSSTRNGWGCNCNWSCF